MNLTLTTIESLTAAQHRQLLTLELLDEQRALFGDIHGALHGLTGRPSSDIQGYVVLVKNNPCGFFLVKRRSLLPPWADGETAVLHGLMIDRHAQGLGVGKATLVKLPALVQSLWPETRQLMLAVDPANTRAHAFYLQLGWQPSGEAGRTANGFEQRMSLRLP